MTGLAGLFLLTSLALPVVGITPPADPAWGAIIISGTPLAYLAFSRLVMQQRITSALLITMAMVASIAIGELFAAGEVAFIMSIGTILEERTIARARKGIGRLAEMVPRQARRIKDGTERMVPIETIRVGDLLRVLPGETFPVDGLVVTGDSTVDQSVMTGESIPVDKHPGDSVFSGTINRYGTVDIRTINAEAESSLQVLVGMVLKAESAKAPLQRTVDKWAAWLVPMALSIAIGTFIITDDILRAVTVLVVFCPCALALATPISLTAAIGHATRHGVLVKSGAALEVMGSVDVFAMDKTGTLTYGQLTVSDIIATAPGWDEQNLLRLAASTESRSEHPLGRAIVAHAATRGLSLLTLETFTMVPGRGIRALIDGQTVLCGNDKWLLEHNVTGMETVAETISPLVAQGKAIALLSVDGKCAGLLALSDTLRPGAAALPSQLQADGARILMLTGDHESTALHFARLSGICDVHAGLLPAEKVGTIQRLQNLGHVLCMVGDGVNDAPALKTADVGITLGSMGSDIAMEAADIAVMGDDLTRIPYLKKLAVHTLATIRFNIVMSMVINFVAIALSMAGILTPVSGALVHNAGSVLVVLNGARLYDRRME